VRPRNASAPRHAARVTTIEHRNELRLVWQLPVQVGEPFVGNRMIHSPVEVEGDEAFVGVVDLLSSVVVGNLGAMAGIEEEALLMVLGPFEKPFDRSLMLAVVARSFRRRGCHRPQPELLEDGADEVDVVDAAFESIGWIGVIVDANQERTLTRRLGKLRGATARKARAVGAGPPWPRCHGTPNSRRRVSQ